MTIEAFAGKNPVTHVDKLYREAARKLAELLVADFHEIAASECYLVSKIGMPITQPAATDVRLNLRNGAPPSASARRRADRRSACWVEQRMAGFPGIGIDPETNARLATLRGVEKKAGSRGIVNPHWTCS